MLDAVAVGPEPDNLCGLHAVTDSTKTMSATSTDCFTFSPQVVLKNK
jgi:hypothetical protein